MLKQVREVDRVGEGAEMDLKTSKESSHSKKERGPFTPLPLPGVCPLYVS